jgi:hypothetical protein
VHGLVKHDRFEMSTRSTVGMCLVALIAALVVYRLHIAQKWDAAFVGTLAAFWYLAGVFRSRWRHISFWTSFAGCFVAHLGFIWFVFAALLRNITTVGIFVWIPVGMVECVGLYYLIDILDRKLSDDRP